MENYRKLLLFHKNKAPLLSIANLDASYITYVDFSKYFDDAAQFNKILLKYKIWLLNLGSNYFPSKVNTL